MNNLSDISLTITKIFNTKEFKKYKEFRFNKYYNIENKEIQDLIIKLNLKKNVEAYYNKNTMAFDGIGVVDIDGKRIVDFNDDMSDMMNKGLDFMVLGNKFN